MRVLEETKGPCILTSWWKIRNEPFLECDKLLDNVDDARFDLISFLLLRGKAVEAKQIYANSSEIFPIYSILKSRISAVDIPFLVLSGNSARIIELIPSCTIPKDLKFVQNNIELVSDDPHTVFQVYILTAARLYVIGSDEYFCNETYISEIRERKICRENLEIMNSEVFDYDRFLLHFKLRTGSILNPKNTFFSILAPELSFDESDSIKRLQKSAQDSIEYSITRLLAALSRDEAEIHASKIASKIKKPSEFMPAVLGKLLHFKLTSHIDKLTPICSDKTQFLESCVQFASQPTQALSFPHFKEFYNGLFQNDMLKPLENFTIALNDSAWTDLVWNILASQCTFYKIEGIFTDYRLFGRRCLGKEDISDAMMETLIERELVRKGKEYWLLRCFLYRDEDDFDALVSAVSYVSVLTDGFTQYRQIEPQMIEIISSLASSTGYALEALIISQYLEHSKVELAPELKYIDLENLNFLFNFNLINKLAEFFQSNVSIMRVLRQVISKPVFAMNVPDAEFNQEKNRLFLSFFAFFAKKLI